jgi:peptidoglycan/xylan/chitin deacetylase (PgdA/CDA1 family)
MPKLRSFAAWTARVVGGALALAAGAATAEMTQAAPPAPTFEAVLPPPVTSDSVSVSVSVSDSVSDSVSVSGSGSATASGSGSASGSATASASGSGSDATSVAPFPELPRSADALSSNLRDGRIITGATPHRLILFSFDDGPDLRYTRGLLDALDEADVRALFFLTARRFAGTTPYERELAAIAQDIVARGHRVGTHTMDHVQLPLVDNAGLLEQVDESADVIERVLGVRPALLRPPGGSRSPRIDGYLAQRGFTQVLWNLGSGDFQVRTADDVLATFRRVLETRERAHGERGGIVLLHDIHAWGVEAFPRMVAYLDRKNCDLLAQGEELYDFVDDPALFFEARAEADAPAAQARPAVLPEAVLAERQIRARARADARCSDLEALDARVAGR